MFLGVLNDEERKAFTVLAKRLIEADGIIVGAEAEALQTLIHEMGVSGAEELSNRSSEALAATFLGRRAKVAALLELIGLGYSDASFSLHEKSLVAKIATSMGFGPEEVVVLDQWVQDHVAHVQKALDIMKG